jgi:transcriptional regulator NrdR family protein
MPQTKKITFECPGCCQKSYAKIVNTIFNHNKIYRRRECGVCHARFTTYEQISTDMINNAYEAGFYSGQQSVVDFINEGNP